MISAWDEIIQFTSFKRKKNDRKQSKTNIIINGRRGASSDWFFMQRQRDCRAGTSMQVLRNLMPDHLGGNYKQLSIIDRTAGDRFQWAKTSMKIQIRTWLCTCTSARDRQSFKLGGNIWGKIFCIMQSALGFVRRLLFPSPYRWMFDVPATFLYIPSAWKI